MGRSSKDKRDIYYRLAKVGVRLEKTCTELKVVWYERAGYPVVQPVSVP